MLVKEWCREQQFVDSPAGGDELFTKGFVTVVDEYSALSRPRQPGCASLQEVCPTARQLGVTGLVDERRHPHAPLANRVGLIVEAGIEHAEDLTRRHQSLKTGVPAANQQDPAVLASKEVGLW